MQKVYRKNCGTVQILSVSLTAVWNRYENGLIKTNICFNWNFTNQSWIKIQKDCLFKDCKKRADSASIIAVP